MFNFLRFIGFLSFALFSINSVAMDARMSIVLYEEEIARIEIAAFLLKIKTLASKGYILDCPLALNTTESSFPREWQKRKSKITPTHFEKNGTSLEIGENGRIESLRYSGKELHVLTRSALKNILGEPDRSYDGLGTYWYILGQYRLSFQTGVLEAEEKVKSFRVEFNERKAN